MEKTIVFTGHRSNHIVYKNKRYDYTSYLGRIDWLFEATKLLTDENYYNEIVNILEFNKLEKIYEPELFSSLELNRFEINDFYNYRGKQSFIPVSKEVIEYYIDYYTTIDEDINDKVRLSNTHLNENVDSFYEFDLQIEIDKIRINGIYDFDNQTIEFRTEENEAVKEIMIDLFGEPVVHPANEGDKYLRLVKNYFFSPKSRIDKIIGVKKYRDTSTIGHPDGEQFTGETEEIILDLHNFDENIYKIFRDHGMLEIEGYL